LWSHQKYDPNSGKKECKERPQGEKKIRGGKFLFGYVLLTGCLNIEQHELKLRSEVNPQKVGKKGRGKPGFKPNNDPDGSLSHLRNWRRVWIPHNTSSSTIAPSPGNVRDGSREGSRRTISGDLGIIRGAEKIGGKKGGEW